MNFDWLSFTPSGHLLRSFSFAAGDFSLRDCCLHQCFALGSGVLPSSQNAPSISSAAEDFSNLCVTDFRLRLGLGPAECVQIEFYHS
jgi:hypothetical protein